MANDHPVAAGPLMPRRAEQGPNLADAAAPGWAGPLLLAAPLAAASPLAWADGVLAWSPAVGLGLAVAAWLGTRAALAPLLAAAGLLVASRALFGPADALAWAAADAGLSALAPALAWRLYHDLAGGHRQLGDPRSAVLFLTLATGAALGGAALARWAAALLLAPAPPELSPALHLAGLWLEMALGALVVTPPLLVLLTPPLARAGYALAEPPPRHAPPAEARDADPRRGDWVEIAGLALGAAALCLILSRLHGRRELLGWQLWGTQLLLIVWASVRQGLRGGALVASAAALAPLLARQFAPPADEPPLFAALLHAHLAAGCSAALLVAAASAWARQHEAGLRRIVAHVPVVISSARLRGGKAELTLVSAASTTLLGCPPEQLLGDFGRWLARVHPDDRELLLAAVSQLARQTDPVVCEYRLLPDASRGQRWVRDVLAPARDGGGGLVGWEGVVTDISEQRLLADDLRRTTSMFDALVANLPAGVFFVQGPAGRPTLVNARARYLLGGREDLAAGLERLPAAYRLHKPDGQPYPADELPVYVALRHGQAAMRDDILVHRPDGRRVPLVTWAAPVRLGPRGGDVAAVWVLEDLTALRQAEAARRESEGRLRAVVEAMAEALLVTDARGAVVACNPAAVSLFATPSDRLLGRPISQLGWSLLAEDGQPIAPEDHPAAAARRTGQPVRNAVLGLAPAAASPGGQLAVRWALVNAVPLGAGVVTTFADISAYVHAREAIRTSEARFRGLVEALPVMLLLADRELRVTFVNPATTAITGYTLEELAEPASWSAVIHPEDLPLLVGNLQGALEGKSGRVEVRYRARDGAEKVALVLNQPRPAPAAGVLGLILDVTRERQLERELARSQRLELIGRLASGVAHDFNNLLNIVLNLTDLAAAHLPGDSPVHADLRRISAAGEQAVGLAGQLLALSKRRAAPARRLDINEAARRALDLLRATLPSAVRVEAELAGEELAVCADETQLQQVIMNLCLNARDAMPQGGTLRVATRRAAAAVVLTVSDSGAGMSEEVRGRIFEPFFSTKESGTGLGLAVVQQIIEGHGGAIAVDSRPGEGARFEVRWPAWRGGCD